MKSFGFLFSTLFILSIILQLDHGHCRPTTSKEIQSLIKSHIPTLPYGFFKRKFDLKTLKKVFPKAEFQKNIVKTNIKGHQIIWLVRKKSVIATEFSFNLKNWNGNKIESKILNTYSPKIQEFLQSTIATNQPFHTFKINKKTSIRVLRSFKLGKNPSIFSITIKT